ncbi:hypothetical protein ACYQR9_15480 [Methylobacterium sp. CM6241]
MITKVEIDIWEIVDDDGDRKYRASEKGTTRPANPLILPDEPRNAFKDPSSLSERFPGIWDFVRRYYSDVKVEPIFQPQQLPAGSTEPKTRWIFRSNDAEVVINDVSDRDANTVG